MVILAKCYHDGYIFKKDLTKSKFYLKKASLLNDKWLGEYMELLKEINTKETGSSTGIGT